MRRTRNAVFAGFHCGYADNVTPAVSRRRLATRAGFGHNDLVPWFANEKGFWQVVRTQCRKLKRANFGLDGQRLYTQPVGNVRSPRAAPRRL